MNVRVRYVPIANDRVRVTMPNLASGSAVGLVIGAPRDGWCLVRLVEGPPGKPWLIVDVPNRRVRKEES